MSRTQTWKAFLIPKLRRVVEFLTAQGITMAGNLLYGLLCVRLLPIADYAKFVVVFGFLGTLTLLMDVNFSGSLIPLVGERVNDKQLIADYVASLRQLAQRLYLVIAPAAAIVFPFLVMRQHWSWQVVGSMIAILLVSAWCARVSGAYGAVLILLRDRKRWYRAQMVSSLGTLALLGIFWAFHWLNGFSAILINVAGIISISLTYFFRARFLLGVTGHPSREKRREIIHLALPNMPNAIFFAFQGQISLLLITIFGHTAGMASVGALGRLSQIFALFSQMNPLLLEPYFAKLPKAKLKANYLGALAAEGAICCIATALAHFFPGLFLWVLGPKYGSLRFEVFLVIASSSIGYFCGVLWVIHSARRFVYWWNGMLTITLTLLVQIFFIVKIDLGSVRAVLTLSLASVTAALVVNVLSGVYGFMRGPREAAQV